MWIRLNILFPDIMCMCDTSRHFCLNFNGTSINVAAQHFFLLCLISPRGALSEYKMTYLLQIGSGGNNFVYGEGCVYYHYVFY